MDIKRLLDLVATGRLTPLDLANPEAMKFFKFRGRLKHLLLESMQRTAGFAIGQVKNELRRQGVTPR